jgi:hypothetical protein
MGLRQLPLVRIRPQTDLGRRTVAFPQDQPGIRVVTLAN